jgi:hypothetical protein
VARCTGVMAPWLLVLVGCPCDDSYVAVHGRVEPGAPICAWAMNAPCWLQRGQLGQVW